MNNYKLLSEGELKIEYRSFGSGPNTLLCFHGFGREASDFLAFEPKLGNRFRILSVNLFFHGNSSFPESRLAKAPLNRKELDQLLSLIRAEEGFERFSLAGYSLGGKIALTLAEMHADQIDHLFLMAPDGIKANRWYYFVSQTLVGQKLNRWSIDQPWIFKGFATFSSATRLSTKRQARFARSQMENYHKRIQVYNIWMAHRKIKPDLEKLNSRLLKYEVPVLVFIGKHERIIPIEPIETWVEQLGRIAQLHLINAGHVLDFSLIADVIFTQTDNKFNLK